MLARLDPRHLSRIRFPLGDADEGRDARRGCRGRACGGASRREPGGVLPRRRRLPLVPRPPGARRATPGAIVDEAGRQLGEHGGYWRFTPGPAPRARRRGRRAAVRPLDRCRGRTRSSSGRGPSLARTRVSARGRLYAPVSRVTAKLRYRSPAVRRDGRGDRERIPAPARRAGLRRGPWPGRRALRRRRRCRFRVGHVRRRGLVWSAVVVAFSFGDLADLALAVFLVAVGLGLVLGLLCGWP